MMDGYSSTVNIGLVKGLMNQEQVAVMVSGRDEGIKKAPARGRGFERIAKRPF